MGVSGGSSVLDDAQRRHVEDHVPEALAINEGLHAPGKLVRVLRADDPDLAVIRMPHDAEAVDEQVVIYRAGAHLGQDDQVWPESVQMGPELRRVVQKRRAGEQPDMVRVLERRAFEVDLFAIDRAGALGAGGF